MKPLILSTVLFSLASPSCDEAKSLAGRVKTIVEKQINQTSEVVAEPVDPALAKLVDQTPEGVIFRKDLPFPLRFEVKTTLTEVISGKTIVNSLFGNQVTAEEGTRFTALKFERLGDQIRYTMEKSTFTDPILEGEDAPEEPVVKELAPPTTPQIYKKLGSAWKSDVSEGFRAVALSSQLGPVFDLLMVENALTPRSLWFGKKRLKIGEVVKVGDKTLPMLVPGAAKGNFTLTLDSIDSVAGHPCGVFSFTGRYSRKQLPNFEGVILNEEVTVQSGKLWLSLLYPLVLRQEAETVQNTSQGDRGAAGSRFQGSVKIALVRDWKDLGSL